MKPTEAPLIYSSIIKSIIIALTISAAWALVLFTLGISHTSSEVDNYISEHKPDLGTALIDGDIIHVQSILTGLEKFGVGNSLLESNIFSGNKFRNIYTGLIHNSYSLPKTRLLITNNGLNIGTLKYQLSLSEIAIRVIGQQWQALSIIVLSNIIILLIINSVMLDEIKKINFALTKSITDGSPIQNNIAKTNFMSKALFFKELGTAIQNMMNNVAKYKKDEVELTELKTEKRIAKQVAHDIRAPLSALSLISKEITGSDEVIQLLKLSINRINNIADDLLKKSNPIPKFNLDILSSTTKGILISTVIIKGRLDQILNETRIQYPDVAFEFNDKLCAETVISNIDLGIFDRMVSILINNAAESVFSNHAYVSLTLSIENNKLVIAIADNGRGIPAIILSRIGEEGLSYGKKDGHGLGLHYVCSSIQKLHGDFKITSIVNKGTVAKLSFTTQITKTKDHTLITN